MCCSDPIRPAAVLIGVPGEDIGPATDAGLVTERTGEQTGASHTTFGYSAGDVTGGRYGTVFPVQIGLDVD